MILADGRVISEKDPPWVIGVTASAIVVGFIANVFLLLRMLGRGNPKYVQFTCIALWTLECIPPTTSLPAPFLFYVP